MKKKVYGIVLMLMLALCVTACGKGSKNNPDGAAPDKAETSVAIEASASTATVAPTAEPTLAPTAEPTAEPAQTSAPAETKAPAQTPAATVAPTPVVTKTPTPAVTPAVKPTVKPTVAPVPEEDEDEEDEEETSSTPVPTVAPTATPVPTVAPTATPEPTVAPTATPVPTVAPTATPVPTVAPTATPVPTVAPTATPVPTVAPTTAPEVNPTLEIQVEACKAYNEIIQLVFVAEDNTSYEVFYKTADKTEYTELSSELISLNSNGNYECNIVGIASGSYDVLICADNNGTKAEKKLEQLAVTALDRSGYAHFNNTDGIGAYNNDGTVKDNTQIIYVNNDNKNTVTADFGGTTYTGLVDILQNAKECTTPLLIRVSGKITTNQYEYKKVTPRLTDNSNLDENHFVNTFSDEYGENLVGLRMGHTDAKEGIKYNYYTTKTGLELRNTETTSTSTTKYNGKSVYNDDTAFNNLGIKEAKNITIEGVTSDAEIFQFGFSFTDCESVEIKGLTFRQYPDDALSFKASNSYDVDDWGTFWVHNCDFYSGLNNWDLTGEQDKGKGDGSVDVHNVTNVTVSYCNFLNTGKSCLVGSSNSAKCKDITYHHNYYKGVKARLPLSRGTNLHFYNNYYDGCSSALSLRKASYGFSENNYFTGTKGAHQPDDTSAIKSYNDVFYSCEGVSSTKVTDRDAYVSNSCNMLGVDYSRFDTSSTLFYYDTENKRTDVRIMNTTDTLKAFLDTYAGVKGIYTNLPDELYEVVPEDDEDEEDIKTEGKLVFDMSGLTEGTTIADGDYVKAGDFKVYYGIDIASNCLKTLKSNIKTMSGIVEFTNIENETVTVEFCSRNSSATDRYMIIYDENKKELYKSHCANKSEKTTYTFAVEPGKTYYIGSSNGLKYYNIY